MIEQYKNGGIRKHSDPNKSIEEQYAAISKAYGVEYHGDVEDFIKRRWYIEKERIMSFIDETVVMLQRSLNARMDITPTI